MFLLYHVYVYLEFLILACTIYILAPYQDIKGVEGLDAHHVGQKALMKKVVADYDELTAPAINVPKLGHTKRHPERGIVSRSTKGITNARQLKYTL